MNVFQYTQDQGQPIYFDFKDEKGSPFAVSAMSRAAFGIKKSAMDSTLVVDKDTADDPTSEIQIVGNNLKIDFTAAEKAVLVPAQYAAHMKFRDASSNDWDTVVFIFEVLPACAKF